MKHGSDVWGKHRVLSQQGGCRDPRNVEAGRRKSISGLHATTHRALPMHCNSDKQENHEDFHVAWL